MYNSNMLNEKVKLPFLKLFVGKVGDFRLASGFVFRPLGVLAVALLLCASASVHAHGTKAAMEQTGKATWYGPKFHGRKTASGERFDMHDLTAAHPSLPLGTIAKITNLSNGRTVKVEINDRGPAKWSQRKGNVIDLSLGAAKKLGFVNKGRTQVKIDILELGQGRGS